MSPVEENTLGVIVGRENLQRRSRSFRRPQRTVSTTRANQDALGGAPLLTAAVVSAGSISGFLLLLFLLQAAGMPGLWFSLSAWLLLAVDAAVTAMLVARNGGVMRTWLFLASLCVGVVVIALDVVGVWGQTSDAIIPTAALAVPMLLLAAATLRETGQILSADIVLAAVLLFCGLVQPHDELATIAVDVMLVAVAVSPALLGVAVVRAYRRMVQLELDLALVQSTVQAPRLAVGMLASEELTRLDDDAEKLLDDVASGRLPLPLPPAQATHAGNLATELRLHLIEGRKETWLRHAVAESEFLGPAVTIDDPASLAGLLDAEQRDCLLLVAWLLVSDAERTGATVHLVFGPVRPPGQAPRGGVRFPIVLETTGVPRRRVDAAVWDAMRVIGPHVDTVRDGSLRVEFDCTAFGVSDP